MALNNMNVLEWNGALPYPPEEQDIVGKYDRESSTDKVMLVNGDVLRGSISLQEDGRIRVKSNHYDVIVPTSKVRSLNQKKEEEKKAAQDNSDVRVFLADQSIVSIRLDAVRAPGGAFLRTRQSQHPHPVPAESPVQSPESGT